MMSAEEYVENRAVTQAEELSLELERDSRRYNKNLSLVQEDE